MKKILTALKQYKRFLISTHVNPDPDGIGSELAVAYYLKSLGKTVTVVNEEPVPERFLFMPGARHVKSLASVRRQSYDAAVIVDCGDLNRIGKVQSLLGPQTTVINIDHHVTNDRFGAVNLVDPGASSTAEIIFTLLRRARFVLTKDVATLLYIGIMTDTGAFRYENTTTYTHQVVSQLLPFGFSVSALYQKLYETIPLQDLKNFTGLVSRFDSLLGGRVIFLDLSKDMVKKFSENFDLRDKIFRYLRAIEGVEVLVIFTEYASKATRINFRSQGKVDVARLASAFNGGGHPRASGGMLSCAMPEARRKVLARLRTVMA